MAASAALGDLPSTISYHRNNNGLTPTADTRLAHEQILASSVFRQVNRQVYEFLRPGLSSRPVARSRVGHRPADGRARMRSCGAAAGASVPPVAPLALLVVPVVPEGLVPDGSAVSPPSVDAPVEGFSP
jgi:hypothetical protein